LKNTQPTAALDVYKKILCLHNLLNIRHKVIKAKSKAIPLQAWTGPDVSRRLRLPYFKTIST